MGYRVVNTDSVEPEPDRPCECRKLSEPGELTEMAINRFRAAQGEQIPLTYHYHETQQEAFYVDNGTLSVETPKKTYEVTEGDLFVVDSRKSAAGVQPGTRRRPGDCPRDRCATCRRRRSHVRSGDGR